MYQAWADRGRPDARNGDGAEGKQSWFGPQRTGIGWRPQTWQGYLITLAVVVAALAAKFAFGLQSMSRRRRRGKCWQRLRQISGPSS
ncbi:hypothetical protein OG894_00290 [Streptomyces sp. NBC_01724]|uniref:hypothetical protein n=1 Tax=unclassified Streptomyces TaxID=2593676 RepID=UPI002E325E72|nr:hypothetical protein [Streptomyces sp. NBC_01724]WTE56692.1 hypothetical protein OG987_42260 [Streptomyces sp. NBC_01620]WTE57353.1 hypothetical protein OG784_00270 [Streptomyces sp. NBC_01617]WTI84870.1 hypothetical protein OHB17_00670 [Streptomyces sp. NBC_00724]WTE64775.1 hypothetical protein OG784_42075 [Streptomyces sp. NBC_01617]WTI92056.1 hypothetical protein OHB17_41335 [Streptomyces sp. NBC_00724]